MPKTKITGTATGEKVGYSLVEPATPMDEMVKAVKSRQEVALVMAVARVSEEDAEWLLKDGYWGRIMHTVRSAVFMRHTDLEEPQDDAE